MTSLGGNVDALSITCSTLHVDNITAIKTENAIEFKDNLEELFGV